ncbi:putative disease resistance protein RGA3 [Magnolia sinica]|uniref:putative disease resistance protein RGA3 n=1 Tax=Magnolia sinica TaxID=86752 RepID=UPI00265A350B|nr:putative disease resistance protein RGA3 [Magnolia sinica]
MADSLVSMVMKKIRDALVSKVMKKLGEEVDSVGGAQAELEKISSTFESIQALLNDAEIIQFHNESMQVWLKKLKDVAYDVEDLLDEMIPWPEPESETNDGDDRQCMENQAWRWLFSLFTCCGLEDWIRLAHESWTDGDDTDNRSIGDKVRTFFPTIFNKVASQRNFAQRIKEVSAKLDQIAADKSKFSFMEIHSFRGGSHPDKAEFQTSSLVDESKMLGRDRDKDIIISKLVSGSSSEEGGIHVISIVGVGGLGKTTLAQLIHNDKRVRSHFNVFPWVCVSDDFNVINLTKEIIKAAGGTSPPDSQLDSLQKQLIQTLQGKLFLIVLDDVWNDDSDRWEKLMLSLQRGAPGSKILVTTRSEKVANTCKPSAYMHELKGLSYDDSWLLFRTRAFAGRKVEDCRALEKIGREIVKKCKGVPLSLKVIGSVMRSKMTTQDWKDILESQTWEIRDIAKGILPALLLSYYNLPVHLKQCFAYCSLFPKDYVMEKDRLVQLWLAQGFIKPDGKREMEAIGGEYFDDLLAHSLFQKKYEYEEEEEVGSCRIHDLLHDLFQFITKNECCIFENGKSDSISVTVRHSSFIPIWETSHVPAPLCHAKKLRTLLQIGDSAIDTIPDHLFQCARSLRALDFGGIRSRIKELPSSIGLLKHLRYLDLSCSEIVELPESVTHLCNLQTLKLNFCRKLQRLPSGMSAMVRLRHLEIKDTRELKYLPEGLGRISSLRTLSRFIVGGNGGCKIGELKRLDSLQGKLPIEHLERVASVDEAKEAQLENKLQLRVLSLNMSPDDALEMSGNGEVERMESVVEALRPSLANLEELEIRGYIGSKFPTWIGDSSFSNLFSLRLINCNKCTQLPGLGRLPSLKYLEIKAGLVKRVGSEFYGNSSGGDINRVAFPKLEELEFSYMYELEEWELRLEDREIMPSLHSLRIYDCWKLKALLTHLPKSLTSLDISGCGEILWPLPNLPSLKMFKIINLENTTCLPYGWKQLESLEILTIKYCSKLRSLPDDLGQLKSLRSLQIYDCPELWSLPQGLWGLTCLQDLSISGNPMLADKCTRKYRSKASHIPNIWIDHHRIDDPSSGQVPNIWYSLSLSLLDTEYGYTFDDHQLKSLDNSVAAIFVLSFIQMIPQSKDVG